MWLDTMIVLEYTFTILLIIGVFLMLASIILVPIWGMLILAGKIDRRGVFSQRAGMVFIVAMTTGLLLFAIALVGFMWMMPI